MSILLAPGQEGCVIECRVDAKTGGHSGCPAGWACDGEGVVSNAGKPGAAVRYCRVSSRVEPHDAGAVAPGTAPDAGRAGPAPAPKRLDVKPTGGQCPAGYKTCGVVCRLACRADADCGLSTARCEGGYCLGPGAEPCAK